jgi:hypothetical protein
MKTFIGEQKILGNKKFQNQGGIRAPQILWLSLTGWSYTFIPRWKYFWSAWPYSRRSYMQSYDIYGMPVAYMRCNMTRQAIAYAFIDPAAVMKEKSQVLYPDAMHIDG